MAKRVSGKPARTLLSVFAVALGSAVMMIVFNLSFLVAGELRRVAEEAEAYLVAANGTLENESRFLYQDEIMFSDLNKGPILDQVPAIIQLCAAQRVNWERIEVKDNYYTPRLVYAVGVEYPDMVGLSLRAGSFITEEDVWDERAVLVCSQRSAEILFGSAQEALGSVVKRERPRWKKVTDASGNTKWIEDGMTWDSYVVTGIFNDPDPLRQLILDIPDFMYPYTRQFYDGEVRKFIGKVKPGELANAMLGIENYYKKKDPDIEITTWYGSPERLPSQNTLERSLKNIFLGISLFFGFIGFLALLTSSFGLMTLMMVDSIERTREIGLRLAMGSTKGGIIRLLISEAFFFLSAGTILGIGIALLFSPQITAGIMNTMNVSGSVTALSLLSRTGIGFSSIGAGAALTFLLGTLFALFPALMASRTAPVACLREN